MARPREFDSDQVLDAAMQLFWTKGYEATSLADLTTAMGQGKGSFYKAYGSKHELFMQAIKRYLDQNLNDIESLLAQAPTAKAGVREFLTTYVGRFHKDVPVARGCVAVNTVVELAPHDEEVAKVVNRHFRREIALLSDAIKGDQDAGILSREKNPEALAEMVVVVAMGLQAGTKGPLRGIDDGRLTELVLAQFE